MRETSHAFATRRSSASRSVRADSVWFENVPRHPTTRGDHVTSAVAHITPAIPPRHGVAPSMIALATAGPANTPSALSTMSPRPLRTRRAYACSSGRRSRRPSRARSSRSRDPRAAHRASARARGSGRRGGSTCDASASAAISPTIAIGVAFARDEPGRAGRDRQLTARAIVAEVRERELRAASHVVVERRVLHATQRARRTRGSCGLGCIGTPRRR